MRSLAKPRKVTIHGSDGQTYAFLGKPKDDLRKDARLMDFNSIINKILNMNSDSRRRQLRTPYCAECYGGMTLYPQIIQISVLMALSLSMRSVALFNGSRTR